MKDEIKILFSGDTTKFNSAVKSMQADTDKAAKGIAASFESASSDIASALGLAFGADKIYDGISLFADFDDRLRKVGSTATATESEMKALERAALQVGAARPRELEEGLQALVQQGLTAKEAIAALPGTVKLASAENISLGESAAVALGLMNSFGEGVEALPALLDKLLKGSQATAMGVLEYGEAIKQIGSVSGTFGADVNDMLAATGLTRNAYIDASTAGAALKSAMADLYNPVGQSAEAIAVLNQRIGGLGLQVKNAQGNFVGWGEIIAQLEAAGASGSEVMRLFGKESGPTLAALVNKGSAAIKSLSAEIENSGGTLDATSERMESGLGGSLRIASSEIEVAALKLVKEFEPGLIAVANAAKYTGDAIDLISASVKTAGAGISATAGAFTGVISVLEEVTDTIGITDDATNSFFDASSTAFGSAKDLIDQAAISATGLGEELEASRASAASIGEASSKALSEVSAAVGINIKSFEEFDKLAADGAIKYDEAVGVWVNAETGKGASISETSDKIKKQTYAATEAAGAIGQLSKEASDSFAALSSSTGFTAGAALVAEAEQLQANAAMWQARGVEVADINAGLYNKITELAQKATEQGQADTAAALTAMAAQYQGFAPVTEEAAKAVSDAFAEAYKATGAFAEEYFATEEARINKRKELLIQSGADAVEAERSAAAEIEAIRKGAMDSFSSSTGFTAGAALVAEAEQLQANAAMWQARGVEVADINAGLYNKITELAQKATEQGQADTAAALTAMAAQYQGFAPVVEVQAETSDAESAINEITVDKEVKIKAEVDTSSASSAFSSLSSEVETISMSTYDYLQDLYNSSLLLNHGDVRERMLSMQSEAKQYADNFRADQENEGRISIERLTANEEDAYQQLYEAKLRGTSAMISEAENQYSAAIKARIDQEKAAAEEIAEAQKEAIDSQKEALQEQMDAVKESVDNQKEALQGQLDTARDQLSEAKEAQKAYWDEQLDEAETYYDEVKSRAEEAKDAMMEAAKEEYENAISLIQAKIEAREGELSSVKEQLSALKQIYNESGAGGSQYFQAEADALATRAQEMKDQGIDQVLIEQWLNDELTDLRVKAADAGVSGIDAYSESLLNSYNQTGEFSAQTVSLQNEIENLKTKLAELQDGGYEQFFSEADYAALGFSSQLESAQAGIDAVKESIAEINGDNFDFAGESAESMAAAVRAAETEVSTLEASLDSLESSLKSQVASFEASIDSLEEKKKNISSSSYTSSSSSPADKSSYTTFTGTGLGSYDTGGYTGTYSGPGVDGKGGFLAILHPDEYVVPEASKFFGSIAASTRQSSSPVSPQPATGAVTSITIENMTVKAEDYEGIEKFVRSVVGKVAGVSDISKLKKDMERHSRRSGL